MMTRIWGSYNDGVRVGSPAFPGEEVNLVGRISRETPETLRSAPGSNRTLASAGGLTSQQIRRLRTSEQIPGRRGSVRCVATGRSQGGTGKS